MPDPITGIIGGGAVLSSVIGGKKQSRAATQAANTQAQSAESGIQEQRLAREEARDILNPYVQAGLPAVSQLGQIGAQGQPAMDAQMSMLGLSGPEAYQQQLDSVMAGPQYNEMVRQGEEAMLQNASATGGLRGGNIQGAMAQFRPEMLNQLMNQRFAGLGGLAQNAQNAYGNLASLGQSSAAGQANQGMQSASNIAGLMGQQGRAHASGAVARGQAAAAPFQALGGIGMDYLGSKF